VSPRLLPPVRIVPRDPEILERRARVLAGAAEESTDEGSAQACAYLLFRVTNLPCAVEMSAVMRAVSRLGRVVSVPVAGGADRAVAFVEERPFAVVDLITTGGAPSRSVEELRHAPALVLAAAAGPVAVAVEGPLELAEEPVVDLSPAAEKGESDLPRLRGRLASGASLYDAKWLIAWAARSVST
jgi:hypothetical protein